MNKRDKILLHLDISHNPEANLIPRSTRALLLEMAHAVTPVPVACHFCAGDSVITMPNDKAESGAQKGISGEGIFYCQCEGCGANGPVADSHNQAIDKWNAASYRGRI